MDGLSDGGEGMVDRLSSQSYCMRMNNNTTTTDAAREAGRTAIITRLGDQVGKYEVRSTNRGSGIEARTGDSWTLIPDNQTRAIADAKEALSEK